MFQFIAFLVWERFASFGYWAFLFALSAVTYSCVQAPLSFNWSRLAVFYTVAIAAVPLALLALYAINHDAPTFTFAPYDAGVPSFIDYGGGVVDARLNLTSLTALDDDACNGCMFINPSLLPAASGGGVRIAARRHRLDTRAEATPSLEPEYTMRYHNVWHSDIVIGELDAALQPVGAMARVELSPPPLRAYHASIVFDSIAAADDAATGVGDTADATAVASSSLSSSRRMPTAEQTWLPCTPVAQYLAWNNTITLTSSTGVEDPRLFQLRGVSFVVEFILAVRRPRDLAAILSLFFTFVSVAYL